MRGHVHYDILLADDQLFYGLSARCLVLEHALPSEFGDGPFFTDHNAIDMDCHFGIVGEL